MSEQFIRYTSAGGPDPSDPAAVVEFIVGLMKAYSGPSPYHDQTAIRALAEQDVARTASIASCLANHFVIDTSGTIELSEIHAPTLIVHGGRDPVFPLGHGQALQKQIPGAALLIMEEAGHELPPPVWDLFVPALAKHTAG